MSGGNSISSIFSMTSPFGLIEYLPTIGAPIAKFASGAICLKAAADLATSETYNFLRVLPGISKNEGITWQRVAAGSVCAAAGTCLLLGKFPYYPFGK